MLNTPCDIINHKSTSCTSVITSGHSSVFFEWHFSMNKTLVLDSLSLLAILENTTILFICPPKFCLSIAFVFCRHHCNSQEKLETKLMQNLGRQTKSIMVFSRVAYLNYSKHWHITNSHRSATPPVQELKCWKNLDIFSKIFERTVNV